MDKKKSFGKSDYKKPSYNNKKSTDKPSESDAKKKYSKDNSFVPRERVTGNSERPYKRRPAEGGEKKSWSSDRPYKKREEGFVPRERATGNSERPYKRRPADVGENKTWNEKRPYKPKESNTTEQRPSRFGDKPNKHTSYNNEKPFIKRIESESSFNRFLEDKRKTNKKDILSLDLAKSNIREERKRKSDPVFVINDGLIRLNKFIAQAGICSRREADNLIVNGFIKVNGEMITELGTKIAITDEVEYKGQKLQNEKPVYIVMNKPKDSITTSDDPEGRRTVLDLLKHNCTARVFSVGRLDRNTTGVLLLTNDGLLAQKLTHPSNAISKIYHVELDKPLTKYDFLKVQNGIELEDGFIRPDDVQYVDESKKEIGIQIHSGRNRIVRRIFEQLEYRIVKLDRVSFGGLTKKDLPRGHWRYLTDKEVSFLKML